MSILLSTICMITMTGCSNAPSPEHFVNTDELSPALTDSGTQEQIEEDDTMVTVNIQVGDKNFSAIMYDNESSRAIVEEMPFTLSMDDYASQEKVSKLIFSLPSAQTKTPGTIKAGDIYLWSGNNLVLFYTTFSNAYSYVPIGYITDTFGLEDALGNESVEITFSIQ